MYKLGPVGQRWLKGFHILFGCAWATSGITITILGSLKPESGPQLYELDIIRKFIDDILVAPTAVACLITALAYSTFTNWGWFKHRWITVKWIMCVSGIIFGIFWLSAWVNSMTLISKQEGINAYSNATYIHSMKSNFWGGIIQNTSVIAAIFISVIKPWGKKS